MSKRKLFHWENFLCWDERWQNKWPPISVLAILLSDQFFNRMCICNLRRIGLRLEKAEDCVMKGDEVSAKLEAGGWRDDGKGYGAQRGSFGVFAMEELQKRTLIGIEAILHE